MPVAVKLPTDFQAVYSCCDPGRNEYTRVYRSLGDRPNHKGQGCQLAHRRSPMPSAKADGMADAIREGVDVATYIRDHACEPKPDPGAPFEREQLKRSQ